MYPLKFDVKLLNKNMSQTESNNEFNYKSRLIQIMGKVEDSKNLPLLSWIDLDCV